MATMPSIPPAGQSGDAQDWFDSAPGRAILGSEAGAIADALSQRPGQHWLWLAPVVEAGAHRGDGRGLRLVRAGQGWRGDVDCSLPLPLPSDAFATVVLQHVVRDRGARGNELFAEAARILMPGGRLWLFVLNPLAPYRWRWRGSGLSASEPLAWRRRLRRHGLVPDAVSMGIGPTWKVAAAPDVQHGPGLRAAYLLRAEKRTLPLTPLRQRRALPLPQGVPAG